MAPRSLLALSLVLPLLLLVACPTGLADATSESLGDNKLLCMAEMVSSIESSCLYPNGSYYVALEDKLKSYLAKCFDTNFTQSKALHVMLPDISPTKSAFLRARVEAFKSAPGGIDVVPTFVPAGQINSEIAFELDHNLTNSHDGWILDPAGIAEIFGYGGFADLTANVTSAVSPELEWSDVLPFQATYGSSWGGANVYNQTVVLPMDGSVELLYYRLDTFQALGLTVPQTWDDVLAIVSAPNVTGDYNGDNVTDFSFCLEQRRDCRRSSYDLMSIAAPYLQTRGTSQGIFFDSTLLDLPGAQPALVSNPGMLRALEIYQNLSSHSPQNSVNMKCDKTLAPDVLTLFAAGRCLMMIGVGEVFQASQAAGSVMKGNVGTAPVPGTTQVLDRNTNTLTPCTPSLCPYAVAANLTGGGTGLINRAPFAAGGGWVGAVNNRSPPEYRDSAIAFFLFLSQPESAWQDVTGALGFSPFRYDHFSNLSRWLSTGNYDANDTQHYLANALAAQTDSNIAMDLRIHGTATWRGLYESAAANASSTLSPLLAPVDVQSFLAASFASAVSAFSKAYPTVSLASDLRTMLRVSLPQPPPMPPAPPAAPTPDTGGPSWLPIAIVLPTVGAVLLIAASVVYQVRNNRKHKNLFGKVRPPGLGADTTILVTDIQDSTALWETLPTEVMDKTIKEHHDCMRRLLLKHSGYESATEGDSFIMAFHSPKDALIFAMDGQTALMGLEWPPELLAVPICAPVWVQGITRDLKPKNLQDILDATDAPLPPGGSQIRALAHGLGHDVHAHTLPSLAHVPAAETFTFATACQRAWKEAAKEDGKKILIFRGLRVRMGIHSGIHNENEVQYNRADARTHYSGETIVMAKAVADAAHGGMVLLSEETYKKLPLERLWDRYLVLHVGEHRLRENLPNLNLYHALNRTLEGRLAHLEPTRSLAQIDPGVLDAPVGCVTVAFQNVVGAQTLLSWNADVAQTALKIFHTLVGEALRRRKGYLVEAVDGLFLAAFQSPADAVLWALECNEGMIGQEWPEELLSHELCEELVISAPTKEGEVVNTIVFRGLRLKTGVDTGQVLGEVHAMTGRMTYRGKVMNRAARIASTASTGQVLCSSDAWNLSTANEDNPLTAAKVVATSLGQFRLKGVADKIEIMHCRKLSSIAPPPMRNSGSAAVPGGDQWKWEQQRGNSGGGNHQAQNGSQSQVSPDDVLLGGYDNDDLPPMQASTDGRSQPNGYLHPDDQ